MIVFYRPEMSVQTTSYSPSSDKPRRVIEDWLTHKSLASFRPRIMSFDPVTKDELTYVHDPDYVDDVFGGKYPNGFGNTDPAVAQSCLYTVGSMVAATLYAVRNKQNACSPTSGFHHAGRSFGGGFCTFNGLAVAAYLAACARAGRILILDCDYHYGNGTADILRGPRLQMVTHRSSGNERFSSADSFFDFVKESFDCKPNIVLYQAGADMHKDDPLGGLLDTRELKQRDYLVFSMAKSLGIPVVWNLAGGYQVGVDGNIKPVLTIHRNTYLAARAYESD